MGCKNILETRAGIVDVSERNKYPHGCRGDKCLYFGEHKEVVRVADHKSSNPMDVYDEFFSLTYQAGAIDIKTKHLVALAASLAAGCQP